MPERPKRRKNNKNKRKNKNNRPDTSKSNSDVNNVNVGNEDNEDNPVEAEVTNTVLDTKTSVQDEVIEPSNNNAYVSVGTPDNAEALIGDLNNNSNQRTSDAILNSEVEKMQNFDISDSVTAYVVESPDNSINKNKSKLKNLKSKSLDNEDGTNIVEITEDDIQIENDNALALINSQNVLVTHVESDIEWENADDLNDVCAFPQKVATGTLSVTTIPLSIAQCDQNKSLTPDEEKSLRSYLKTLNLVTQPENINTIEIKTEIEQIINQEIKQRLRKKALADDLFLHRLGPPRILDVIDEEGSSESSMTSRRQSYLSDKKSDVEDLEDDVFEDNKSSNKNKTIKHKVKTFNSSVHKKSIGQLVPQECVLVGAKIKEPEVTEARGEWTMKTVEKLTGAEVVYLTDTSSSSSSLHEIGDDDDGVDTDVSIRMITPTIEVTDTENFLKKTFISADNKENKSTESSQIPENKNDHKSNEYHKPLNELSLEHIIKIKYEDDPNEPVMFSNPADNVGDALTEKGITENNKHMILSEVESTDKTIEDKCKVDPMVKYQPDEGMSNERIIGIEIEKDLKEIQSNEQNDYAQNVHEIVVLSTDNIKTNLYVKDINEVGNNRQNIQVPEMEKSSNASNVETKSIHNKYDLEAKVIKCEFNDAINNLIKEVTSDSEGVDENTKDKFTRQDSSSSVDSSQCTAKYNPNCESLNDISNIVHDETSMHIKLNADQSTTSHVNDVFECVTGGTTENNGKIDANTREQPLRLRDICVRNIASLPYGNKILEELASVSERLQNFTALEVNSHPTVKNQSQVKNMPYYRLPDVSTIEKISLQTKVKDPTPPPIQPRNSSLKKSHDEEHWTGIPTKSEPVYVCLSPSQKMLMDKTNTVITKDDASHLVDMHSKFVDRRGYNEHYKNERQREESEFNNPPIVPFKSQTGSRLLALIRDPSLTRNIHSITDRLNNSFDELQVKRTTHTTFTKNNHDKFETSRNISFKPIPPPRPKKYSSSFYESDESSDFTDNSMRSMKSERKLFHYSTGNLNKEIENDISSIQNMHKFFTDTRDELNNYKCPRRPSLPKDLCEQQMEYIRKKEKEVEAEIQRLEALKDNVSPAQRTGPRAPLVSEKEVLDERIKDSKNYSISHKKDVVVHTKGQETKKGKMSSLFSSSQEELLRERMYSEYVTQMAEREERKHHKVIKITNSPGNVNSKISKSMSAIDTFDSKVNNRIEKEFISKAKERWDKLGIKDPETEDEREYAENVYKEPKVIEHKIKVIEGGKEKDVKKLPSHLQEFVRFTAKDTEKTAGSSGESKPGPATPHLVIMCAVILVVIAVGKYFLRLLRYK